MSSVFQGEQNGDLEWGGRVAMTLDRCAILLMMENKQELVIVEATDEHEGEQVFCISPRLLLGHLGTIHSSLQ